MVSKDCPGTANEAKQRHLRSGKKTNSLRKSVAESRGTKRKSDIFNYSTFRCACTLLISKASKTHLSLLVQFDRQERHQKEIKTHAHPSYLHYYNKILPPPSASENLILNCLCNALSLVISFLSCPTYIHFCLLTIGYYDSSAGYLYLN